MIGSNGSQLHFLSLKYILVFICFKDQDVQRHFFSASCGNCSIHTEKTCIAVNFFNERCLLSDIKDIKDNPVIKKFCCCCCFFIIEILVWLDVVM